MKKIFLAIIVSLIYLSFQPALVLAADKHEVAAAQHDGQVRRIGSNNVELVAKDSDITLYFTDAQNNEINTEHGRATATIRYVDERQTVSVDLKMSEGNRLHGSGDFEIKPDTTIVVFVRLNGEDAHAGKFELNSTKEPEEHDRHHDDHDHDHDHDNHDDDHGHSDSHNDDNGDHGSSHHH